MEPAKKKRSSTTEAQKRRIRAHQKQYILPQAELQNWIKVTFQIDLAQSTISSILSKKYEYLDANIDSRELALMDKTRRKNVGAWPELEACLAEWIFAMEVKKGTLNGEVIQVKATKFWEALQAKNIKQYVDEEMPCWSEGWMDRFKKRYGFREFQQHGEAGSVDTVEAG